MISLMSHFEPANGLPADAPAHPSHRPTADSAEAAENKPLAGHRIGYLVSQLPALSHTFILKEIIGLRQCGAHIVAASVNRPDRPSADLTHDEQHEQDTTFYIKAAGAKAALAAHLRTLVTQPAAWWRGFKAALRLGEGQARATLYQCFYFTEALMVEHWLRAQQLNHLHVHFGTAAANVGLLVHHTFERPWSLMIHGPDEFYAADHYHLREKFRSAEFLLTIGHYCRSQVQLLSEPQHWQKIDVARLGVDVSRFKPVAKPARAADDQRPFEILCVGRLVGAKGQGVLLEAVVRLLADGHKLRVRLVGHGPDRGWLEQRAAELGLNDVVRFEGGANQDKILSFYEQADCFVLASFAEGIPVVLMEAMAMQLPTISTRITGIPELIDDGVDGLLVAASDVRGLAKAIDRLITNPELCQTLGQAGRDKVLQAYNHAANVQLMAEVFRRRLGDPIPQARSAAQQATHQTTQPATQAATQPAALPCSDASASTPVSALPST